VKTLLLCAALALTARADFRPESFLAALAMKETGRGWNGKPGPAGELSRWQITRSVWREEMGREDFAHAARFDRARVCVLRHLAALRERIVAAGEGPTPERLATCWHFGPSHAKRASEWGQEVANLYERISQ